VGKGENSTQGIQCGFIFYVGNLTVVMPLIHPLLSLFSDRFVRYFTISGFRLFLREFSATCIPGDFFMVFTEKEGSDICDPVTMPAQ
jgi:hypothetical protein